MRSDHFEPIPPTVIPAMTGAALLLNRGDHLEVIDPEGEQVSDLICYAKDDVTESLSSGCSIDYNETIYLTAGHSLFSNKGRPMLKIIADSVGVHDILLAPCNRRMFERFHNQPHHANCRDNLSQSLIHLGVLWEGMASTFNIFMNVRVGPIGGITILPPPSKPGDSVVLSAEMDLIVGLTACADEQTNNGRLKPIWFRIHRRPAKDSAGSAQIPTGT